MTRPQIAILDFGSQYTHLITRRIRQLGVLAVIYPPTVTLAQLRGVKGIILSGGPNSVYDKTAVSYNKQILKLSVPILGLCYGHQLLAHASGGTVKPGKTKEYGYATMKVTGKSPLLMGVGKSSNIWMSHGDSVAVLPKGFTAIGSTADCPVAAMANDETHRYGLQFHPEVTHSHDGLAILKNFVFDICGSQKDWSLDRYWRQTVLQIKKTVGTRNVFLLVSGGVDSTVCFALLEKVLGKKRVYGLHIDNGFMRKKESAWVKTALAKAGFDDLVVVDASDEFLKATKGLVDPEKKREAVGKTFLKIKDDIMVREKFKPSQWILGQGTIYPDTIESAGTKHADKIKTHHNRVSEILKLMKLGALVEPLVELYKDEVRELGKKMKLPKSLLDRHPFPGPGLSVRVLCSTGKETVARRAVIEKSLKKIAGAGYTVAVAPLKSVGVQGDQRTYRHPAIISGPLDWKHLHDVAVRMTNEVPAVNRVVYAAAPQGLVINKLHTTAAYLTRERLDLLRTVDDVVMKTIRAEGIYNDIWQFTVALVPLTIDGGETIVLRPVESKEAMTVNFYPMKKSTLQKLTRKIMAVSGVDAVVYDVTNKPPGTIEWE